jgi:hypothetical protein
VSGYQQVFTALVSYTNVAAGAVLTQTALCPTGKRVLGGGYDATTGLVLHPVSSFPPTVDSWRVSLRLSQDLPAATVTFRVYAVCAAVSN